MANFNPVRGTLQDINNTPIVDGQFLFVTDQDEGKNSLYIDVGANRIEIGAFDWIKILNKPFTTIGSHLTVDTNNVLSADIQTWSEITSKPFETIGAGLTVNSSHELIADIGWSDVPSKPFETIGSHLTVDPDTKVLSADIQDWTEITNKPFTSIGARLTVSSGVLSADIQSWSEVTSKPFTSIGEGLTVINGELCATGGGTGVDWSTEVVNKPFETLGSSFTVNVNGVLNLNNINWNIISNKPFTTIGTGLDVDSNDVLTASLGWSNLLNKPFTNIGSGLTVTNNMLTTDIGWTDVASKPFTSIGGGLNVTNGVLDTVLQSVTAPTTGTASASATRSQALTISGANPTVTTKINGTTYMEYSQTLNAGVFTDYTFQNSEINANSIIDVYTSVWGIVPSSVIINTATTPPSCTVRFTSDTTISDFLCRIYIK